jgi:DNA-binding CsgD family transcriptional regulator
MRTLVPSAARGREELVGRAGGAPSVGELFRMASGRLRRLLPFDASVWLATDPATNIPTAPTRVEGVGDVGGPDACLRLWELEFLVEDVNLYRDLARAEVPAGGLRMATDDRPARSARYRRFVDPLGFGDELRAVMRVDGSPWASVCLLREHGRPAFDETDAALLAGLSAPIAEAVREHARPAERLPAPAPSRGPGLMVFTPGGELASVNDDALAWLEEMPAGPGGDSPAGELPMVVLGLLMRARAVAEDRDHRPARARLRSPASGRWLVCHASCMRDPDGRVGDTALVIEPAPASEVAPIILQAYELSAREGQITGLICQGCPTAEIAARLHLSAHTVRDYVKAIFEKVGVSSRGELVARLFAERYAPVHFAPGGLEAARD